MFRGDASPVRLGVTRKRSRFGGAGKGRLEWTRRADMECESQTHRESPHGDELATDVTCDIVRLESDGGSGKESQS